MPEDQGFNLLEKMFAEIRQQKPYSDWSKEKLYSNLDVVWKILEKDYKKRLKTNRNIQQSWNNNNGYFYEKVILDYLNSELENKGIAVYNMGKRQYYKMPEDMWKDVSKYLKVNLLRKCINQRYPMKIEIELDLLAVDTNTNGIITSMTCKTRFRERIYQPLYASRHFLNIRTVFITMDRDRNLKTCEKPSEKRVLLESFMDSVFINSSNEHLGFCAMIKPFKDIVPTLLEWKRLNGSGQPTARKTSSDLSKFV